MTFKVKCIIFLLFSLVGVMLYFSIFPYIPAKESKVESIDPSFIVQDS